MEREQAARNYNGGVAKIKRTVPRTVVGDAVSPPCRIASSPPQSTAAATSAQGKQTVSYRAHNPVTAGSIPAPASDSQRLPHGDRGQQMLVGVILMAVGLLLAWALWPK